jgi:ADP-heptose:LPS heptosyltransferase
MRRIAVIRPGALGDTILTLPVLTSIMQAHPGAQVVFVGTGAYRDLIPPEASFVPIDGAQALWLFDRDAVDDRARREFEGAIAYVMLKSPEMTVRSLESVGAVEVRTAVPSPPPGVHITSHLAQALGLDPPPPTPCLARLAPKKRREGLWVHPGSGGPAKCVPVGVFAELACAWRKRTGDSVSVTLGEADAFVEQSADFARIEAAAGERVFRNRPLLHICETLGASRIYLGNDSGVSHLAAALGVPSLVFFTCTDPAQWSPWGASATLSVDKALVESCVRSPAHRIAGLR